MTLSNAAAAQVYTDMMHMAERGNQLLSQLERYFSFPTK
jgi:hypothetical protein